MLADECFRQCVTANGTVKGQVVTVMMLSAMAKGSIDGFSGMLPGVLIS